MINLLRIIDQLLKKILGETLTLKPGKSDCQKFYYEILFLNIRLFEGAIFLLAQFKDKPLLQVSFVSVMRDLITSVILAEFISYKEHDSLANIDEELELIYAEHYLFQKKSRKIERALFESYEEHAKNEERFDALGERYKDDDGKLKRHLEKTPSTFQRIKYIESKQKKDDKHNIRALYLWYTEFSKIAHFGELTVHKIANRYASKSEKEVFENYQHLLKTITIYIVGLLAKVCYEDPVETSIGKDLERIWNYEYST